MSINAVKNSQPARSYSRRNMPVGPVARANPSQSARSGLAVVPNPLNPAQRHLVTVNRAVDLLEVELSAKRISPEAYDEGRTLQAVWERASGSMMGAGSNESGVGGDKVLAREFGIMNRIEDARTCVAIEDEAAKLIGELGVRFLRSLLVGGETFASIAASRATVDKLAALRGDAKGPGERAISKVAERFRGLLQDMADEKRRKETATGR